MIKHFNICASILALLLLAAPATRAAIDGVAGANVDLYARAGQITLGDGNTLLTWGFSTNATEGMQYPGPTLIVNQGDSVTVTLHNALTVPVSIVFPGQEGVSADPATGEPGILTRQARPGGTVKYTFTASQPGTYLYQSGTNPELQIEMGLVGALIVRPTGFSPAAPQAYQSSGTAYDREYLFFLTEMDRSVHEAVQQNIPVDSTAFTETLWFINGRNGPDTMLEPAVGWLPSQPYNALARAHPGERVLMRIIGAGRDIHPFHHHGNNAWLIARDGRVFESTAGAVAASPDFVGIPELVSKNAKLPDMAQSNFTIQIAPGNTYDALFTWTGRGLNWDIYGNAAGHSGSSCNAGTRVPLEDPSSHCKALPVVLPEQQSVTFGGMWSGSPYLGTLSPLPPLQGGLNPNGGFTFMWHSHTERELTNDDIFPGGMMTMMIIEAPNVAIE